MDFIVLDLFGGTIDFYHTRQQAEQASRETMKRYREQAKAGRLPLTDYIADILVAQVVTRQTVPTGSPALVEVKSQRQDPARITPQRHRGNLVPVC